jgi:hypothetical protein
MAAARLSQLVYIARMKRKTKIKAGASENETYDHDNG